jgi:hypothetical protein
MLHVRLTGAVTAGKEDDEFERRLTLVAEVWRSGLTRNAASL